MGYSKAGIFVERSLLRELFVRRANHLLETNLTENA